MESQLLLEALAGGVLTTNALLLAWIIRCEKNHKKTQAILKNTQAVVNSALLKLADKK